MLRPPIGRCHAGQRRDSRKRHDSGKGNAAGRPHDEAGAVLILALVFLVIVGGAITALTTWTTNDLNNSGNLQDSRSLQFAASSATNFAIQSIRYTPELATGETWNASPPEPCWGTGSSSALSVTEGTTSENVAVWCSTVWNPTSLNTRVVTFSACPATESSSTCAANPSLKVVVTYDDYPPGTNEPTSAECTIYCGTSMTVNSWVWS